jgi:hypothetical protein
MWGLFYNPVSFYTLRLQMSEWVTNDESEMIWKGVAVAPNRSIKTDDTQVEIRAQNVSVADTPTAYLYEWGGVMATDNE